MPTHPDEIEDRYPLTPLQQGMLYHAVASPHTGVDIEQLVCTLREPVDAPRLRAAWEQVVARHAILRTSFRWDSRPVQEVAARVGLPWTERDLSDLSAEEREATLAEFLRADRELGFAMDQAPLLRLTLFRFGADDFRLVWTFHHALLDGRSFPLVLGNVFGFYDGIAPRPAPRRFRDFVDWLQTQQPAGSEAFWRTSLSGFTAPTPIPVEHLGECAAHPMQGDAECSFSAATTERLRELAQTHDLTLNTFVQGAWAVLLSRYSGEEDVVFGATRACRRGSIDGADEMVGLFINTLPVRTHVGATLDLIPWLKELRAQWIAMRPHEHTPLASVQSWSGIPSGKLLFDSIVVFENYDPNSALQKNGPAWTRRDFRLYEQTNFALTLAAYSGEQLKLRVEFDRRRFDGATIERLLGHLTTLLSAVAENPRRQLRELPILTTHEHHQLIHDWTARTLIEAPEKTLHQLFAEQAARTPDAIAVRCNEHDLTYAELDRRAAQLAHHLRGLGVSPETIVGLCVERSVELIIGVLGILKAGGAYLPIDLAYPPERLAFMVEDAQAPVVVTQTHLATRLPAHGARVVCINDFPSDGELHDPATPDSLAYVIFTSGSTGQPKGALITHRNVVRLMAATHPWFGFDERDVWTMFHSVAFDFSVWEIWGALLYGGCLVVVPHIVSRSPDAFRDLLERERVTVLNQTPSAFRQLIAADASRDGKLTLRFVIFGGEALELQSLRPWFDRHGDFQPQLVNMYGITETTVHVTYRPLRAADLAGGSVIGVPIPDLEVFILDPELRPTPIGVPGEMFVGGAGLARGYLRRPELTAERFIAHPWRAGDRLYRTGDLARWLPGHDIEYLGRIDQQVKIRGFRIELGEIESVLVQHPEVREAVVVARPQAVGEKRLVAYIVPAHGERPPDHDLRIHLKAKLPDYMVPSAFVSIERVPLTNNGKTDLRALPEPDPTRPDTGREFTPPRTAAEFSLAEIWRRVLRLERVGVNDNFFDLGGDSILSILVVAQARQAGFSLTPKLLFDHPTIAELTASAPAARTTKIEAAITGDVPLTPIQRWFFDHEFTDPHHWNQAIVLNIPTPIPPAELERAVHAVAERHAVFRLRFTPHEHGWQQAMVQDAPAVACATVRTRDDAKEHASLDITAGPLLRVIQALEPSPSLLIVAHHLVVDGVSWHVLIEDIEATLNHRAPPASTTSFARWAQLLAQAATSPILRDELPYWHELAATSEHPLPLDTPDGDNLESSASTIVITLSREETDTLLRRLPGVQTSRLHDALVSALALAFAHWTGRDSMPLDLEGHGREEEVITELAGTSVDLSRTVGWFTSIYPARVKLPKDKADTLRHVAAQLQAIPRRGIGYGLLRHVAGLAPRSHAQVLFNYLGQFDAVSSGSCFQMGDFSTEGWHSPRAHRTHLIEINCLVIDGHLEARWTYSRSLHREATIAALATKFRTELLQLQAAPESYPLAQIQQLYHALETAKPGAGFDQWHGTLRGPLDVERYKTSWCTVVDRHAALRTSFGSNGTEVRQLIHDSLSPEWVVEDWRQIPQQEVEPRFAEFLRDDERLNFDTSKPPLTRIGLLRIADYEWRFVWSHHHLQIDGWSWPIVLREVAAIYAGQVLPAAPRYTQYLDWLVQQPRSQSSNFWREHLRGFREATPLPLNIPAHPLDGRFEQTVTLAPATCDQLKAKARSLRVTLNALVQTAWVLVLSRRSGRDDVVFGASFSGRPSQLSGVENIVGPMVNNLPVRTKINASESLDSLIRRLHEQSFTLQDHQLTPLPEIQACSELPWHARVFDTLVVFQNYVVDNRVRRLGADVELVDFVTPIRTNYPLTLVITPRDQIDLTLIASSRALDPHGAAQILDWIRALLVALSGEQHRAVADLGTLIPARTAPRQTTLRGRSANFIAPRSAIETQIAGVWCEAFGSSEVGVRDNFFDLGGHSLLMIRVHARLREVLARDISIVRMFQHPTIEALASHLDGSSVPASVVSAAQERAARQRAAIARKR